MLNQTYFELQDIRALKGRAWIPLRCDAEESFDPGPGFSDASRYTGIATVAVFPGQETAAERMGWDDLDPSPHRSHPERDFYHSADLFRDSRSDEPIGLNLVIDQAVEGAAEDVWYLHPDLVVALGLVREGDVWFRPKEGWVEVVRLVRDGDNSIAVEIRAEHLADYLVARGMKLYASSYVQRVVETDQKPSFSWPDDEYAVTEGRDERLAQIGLASGFSGGRGFRIQGALWRTEWFASPRVRGDKEVNAITFATGPIGERVTPQQARTGIDWLFFEPAVVNPLLRYRGGGLHWYSQETGGLGAADARLHFGVNAKGLITVFAKDIGNLQAWEQRIWAMHSVASDGGVAHELFEAQMMCRPATTLAPEPKLGPVLARLEEAFRIQFGEDLLRPNAQSNDLLSRCHRFRAAEADGLLALAKDLTRLFVERVDVAAVHRAAAQCNVTLKKDWKALKSLEGLAAVRLGEPDARTLMAPWFGTYDLRLADAHLSSGPPEGLDRVDVDPTAPGPMQGRALLARVIAALDGLADALPSTE